MNSDYKFEIADGPSTDRVLDTFKYAYTNGVRIYSNFKVVLGTTMPPGDPRGAAIVAKVATIITSLQHESGDDHQLILRGFIIRKAERQLDTPVHFKAYYNAKTRKGFIETQNLFEVG